VSVLSIPKCDLLRTPDYSAEVNNTKMLPHTNCLHGAEASRCQYVHSPATSSVTTFMLSKSGDSEVGGL